MKENKCEFCGSTIGLEKHHKSYVKKIIILLCRKCHRKIHSKNCPDNLKMFKCVEPSPLKLPILEEIKNESDRDRIRRMRIALTIRINAGSNFRRTIAKEQINLLTWVLKEEKEGD